MLIQKSSLNNTFILNLLPDSRPCPCWMWLDSTARIPPSVQCDAFYTVFYVTHLGTSPWALKMIPSSYTYYGDKSGRSYDDIDHDWGRVFRLLFISGLATFASMGNVFTLSAIIGDDLLRKKGKQFLITFTIFRFAWIACLRHVLY